MGAALGASTSDPNNTKKSLTRARADLTATHTRGVHAFTPHGHKTMAVTDDVIGPFHINNLPAPTEPN